MSLKITHKYSTAAGTPPASGDIDVGEVAINAADAELYTKDNAGNIRKFQNTTTGTADGVQFTQAGTGAVQRTVESKLQDVVSVKDFGAVGDGVTDDTAAIQAAVSSGKQIFAPKGDYLITDCITLNTGQRLHGEGPTSTQLIVPQTFNLAALGVVRLASGEPGARLEDIGFVFDQPTSGVTRATLIQYPPAIYAASVPRFYVNNVRWTRAWDGLNATSNSGGFYIGRVESCAFNVGLSAGGSLDFSHIESWHNWCFGASTGDLYGIWQDGNTVAASIAEMDGLAVDKFAAFQSKVALSHSTVNAPLPTTWNTLQLDGDGATLSINGGTHQIGVLYSTKNTPNVPSVSVVSGRLLCGIVSIRGAESVDQINVSGGELRINSGCISNINNTAGIAVVSGGILSIQNATLSWANAPRTAPVIRQQGTGRLVLKNLQVEDNVGTASGAGALAEIATDVSGNIVDVVGTSPHSITLPSTVSNGNYNTEWIDFTPSITPETAGDWNPGAYLVREGQFKITNKIVTVRVRYSSTPTFTTASGQIRLTGLPITFSSDSSGGSIAVEGWNLGGAYTNVGIVAGAASSNLLFECFGNEPAGYTIVNTSQLITGNPLWALFMASFKA